MITQTCMALAWYTLAASRQAIVRRARYDLPRQRGASYASAPISQDDHDRAGLHRSPPFLDCLGFDLVRNPTPSL